MFTCLDCGGEYASPRASRCVPCGQVVAAHAGANVTPETRAKMSDAARRRYEYARERREKVATMSRQGMSLPAIAAALGVPYEAVKKDRLIMGAAGPRHRHLDKFAPEMIRLRNEGVPVKVIAHLLGVARSTVRKYLAKHCKTP